MAYVNAIEYSSGTAMREAARAIHKRLFNPTIRGMETIKPRPPKYLDLKTDFINVAANQHGVPAGGFTREAKARADKHKADAKRQAILDRARQETEQKERVRLEAIIQQEARRQAAMSRREARLQVDLELRLAAMTNEQKRAENRTSKAEIDNILRLIANYFGYLGEEIKSDLRHRELCKVRQIAMFIAREVTGKSFPIIGRQFGGRDHTTVIHAVRKVSRLIASDPATADHVAAIMDKIAPSRAIEGEPRIGKITLKGKP